jgi:hypothetical protein
MPLLILVIVYGLCADRGLAISSTLAEQDVETGLMDV